MVCSLLQNVSFIRTILINCKFCLLFCLLSDKCLNMLIHTHTPICVALSSFFSIQECEFYCVINIQFWLNYALWKNIGLLHVFYFLALKFEREYEMKRLNNLKCQEDAAKEIQFSLRERQVGLRRPLPPMWQSPLNRICTLAFRVWRAWKAVTFHYVKSGADICMPTGWWANLTDLLGPCHILVPLYHKQQHGK